MSNRIMLTNRMAEQSVTMDLVNVYGPSVESPVPVVTIDAQAAFEFFAELDGATAWDRTKIFCQGQGIKVGRDLDVQVEPYEHEIELPEEPAEPVEINEDPSPPE